MIMHNGKEFTDWRQARAALAEPEPTPAPVVEVEPEPETTPALAPERTGRRQALTEKYRPGRLSDLAGQAEAVAVLSAFAADPYPAAFIFSGDTGCGKTSAAWALAGELGCGIDINPPEFGGVWSLPSGEHTPQALQDLWPQLSTIPFQSSRGMKMLIVNEVERLTGKVEQLWLDKLEDIPANTVIVFTTNALDSLPARFVDRCIGGVLEFADSADDLLTPARTLAASIWKQETGGAIPADVLECVTQKSIRDGRLSFRRVVQSLVPLIAAKGR
jgi:replication-associated recombination protein RarA